ncbi:Uncharacterised protein [Legionella hackeliae]|nr:hypothetical protein [Legionella hackeliae]STX47851.1 Uncharacterised protein [Legionella hackeliae]
MLSTFTEAKWSLIDNLPRLLESVVKQEHLKIGLAVEALKKIKLKPEHAQLILDTLYKSPQHHNSLTDAVITLSQMDALTDENLAIVIRTPQYADKVAEGIRILKKISMDDSENKTCLSKVPEYAVSVASLFKQLVKVKQFSRKTQELALKQPENAEVAAKIIRFLRLENMFLAKNLPSFEGGKINLCEELLTRNLMILEFSDLLSDMESAEILTAPNLGKLIQNSKFIRSIASACCCLNNNSRLSQENFDALFDDPRRAIEIALALQGSAKPAPDNTVQDTLDKGIEDYLRIRRAAILMAQGQRKDSLFKPVNINEKQLERYNELFKNRPIINSLELQKDEHKELLLKIAKMCGNGHLEPEAEQAIASDAFIEFKAR